MATHWRFAVLPLILVFALSSQVAHADIYTWVDASGAINVSNLSPPEGVRVTRITHENPVKTAARLDTARDVKHDAEVQALSDRVRQLEREVQVAKTYTPPSQPIVMYASAPPAPVAAPAYVDAMPAPMNVCDPAFTSCGYWWGQGFYPGNVIVVRAPSFRRTNPFHGSHRFQAAHHFAAQRPMQHPHGGMPRR
ncbi:MAG TPA: DUF4124 domain-containing protein [Casimicrobiaceae bacterium]|jgi:hypothetical protein